MRTGVSDQVGFLDRQHAAQVSQIMEFAGVGERRIVGAIDSNGEYGLPLVHTEENHLLRFEESANVGAIEQYSP
jgi:hypothetical protein